MKLFEMIIVLKRNLHYSYGLAYEFWWPMGLFCVTGSYDVFAKDGSNPSKLLSFRQRVLL